MLKNFCLYYPTVLDGSDVLDEHCTIVNNDGLVTLHPIGDASIFVNGRQCSDRLGLTQGDHIFIGSENLFRFNHPQEAARLREVRRVSSLHLLLFLSAKSMIFYLTERLRKRYTSRCFIQMF